MGPGLAIGIAVLLTALNPKNLTLSLSAAGEAAQYGIERRSARGRHASCSS